MPTLQQVKDRVDTWLSGKWPTLVARQDNYLANRGGYWQGLRTHTFVPAHTSGSFGDSVADQLDSEPTDVFQNWSTAFPDWVGVAIPCAVQCDVYDGPQGMGWCATIWAKFNGTVYTRSQNVGPESFRTQAWSIYSGPGIQ